MIPLGLSDKKYRNNDFQYNNVYGLKQSIVNLHPVEAGNGPEREVSQALLLLKIFSNSTAQKTTVDKARVTAISSKVRGAVLKMGFRKGT